MTSIASPRSLLTMPNSSTCVDVVEGTERDPAQAGLFPRALADVLIVGGACYGLDLLVRFLAPEPSGRIYAFVIIPPTIAEVWALAYVLLKGIRSSREIVGEMPVVPVPAWAWAAPAGA